MIPFKLYYEMKYDTELPKKFKPVIGSCMLASEIITKKLLRKGIHDFKVVEGYITFPSVEWEDRHTWIELDDGEIIDHTSGQWGINNIIYIKNKRKYYSPEEYLQLCIQYPEDSSKYFETN